MLFLYLFLVLFLLVPSNLGINNGTDANIADFPWMVRFYEESEDWCWCGGTLISPNWVLTAAHCKNDRITKIRAGFDQVQDTVGVYVNITEFIAHPTFIYVNGTPVNDIALVHLETPISGDNIQAIPLPELNAPVPEGSFVNVTGWGLIVIDDESYIPDHLQVATMPITSTADCKKAYEEVNLPVFQEFQFCAGIVGDIAGICSGDEGGPIVFNKTVIGIVSWEYFACSDHGMPVVLTNVANYRDWIHEITGI